MTEYPNLVWQIYITDTEGVRRIAGSVPTEKQADEKIAMFLERGFTRPSKIQVLGENADFNLLERADA